MLVMRHARLSFEWKRGTARDNSHRDKERDREVSGSATEFAFAAGGDPKNQVEQSVGANR